MDKPYKQSEPIDIPKLKELEQPKDELGQTIVSLPDDIKDLISLFKKQSNDIKLDSS